MDWTYNYILWLYSAIVQSENLYIPLHFCLQYEDGRS